MTHTDLDHRMYKTGDIVRWLDGGQLEFLGRADNQVKLRGFRIELGEIETVLKGHFGVKDIVVLARNFLGAGSDDKRLVAYVIPENIGPEGYEEQLTSDLRSYLNGRLPEYMFPSYFVIVESFPLTPNGKVDRKALPQPDVASTKTSSTYQAPTNTDEEIVLGIWEDILGLEGFGIDDNFFELGGHSLLVTQVISRIRKSLEVDLPVKSLFEKPTVRGLSEEVVSRRLSASGVEMPPIFPYDDQDKFVLSFSQQRLWFLEQLNPGTPDYNIPLAFKIEGDINVDTFKLSLKEIMTRQEVFQTSINSKEGQAEIIKISDNLIVPLQYISLRDDLLVTREGTAIQLINEDAGKPFNLNTPPLVRFLLIETGDQQFYFGVTFHHIISDALSSSIFFRELARIYSALVEGNPHHLSPLDIQYTDYARWQRDWLKGEILEKEISHWKNKLAGMPPVLELAYDKQRPVLTTGEGDYLSFDIPEITSSKLRAFNNREGITAFMFFLTVFEILLAKYSNQLDIAIGTPVANRPLQEFEDIIGFFVNTLVLRLDLEGNPSFIELVNRTKTTSLDAFSHSQIPFEMLVDAIQPERNLSHSPLFQVMFVMHNLENVTRKIELPGLVLETIEPHVGVAKFDLTLTIVETQHGFSGALEYSSDIFVPDTIRRMIGHFQQLVDTLLIDPELSFNKISLLTDEQKSEIIWNWNELEYGIPEGRSLASLFEEQVEKTPDRVAVVADGRNGREQLTYEDLNRKANQLARRMKRMGVERGELVGLFVERSVEMMVGLMGVLKAGAAYVPMDPLYPVERLGYIIEDVSESMEKPPVVVVQSWLEEKLPEGIGEVVRVDADWDEIGLESGDNLGVEIESTDLAYVLYTSGSTGKPKGVMIEQRSVVNIWMALRKEIYGKEEGEGLRVAQNAPLLFDVSVGQWVMMMSGETVYLVPQEIRMSGEKLVEWIEENRIEVIDCVPTQLKIMLRAGLTRGGEHWRPRDVLPAGEAIDDATWDELAASEGIRFTNLYGPTECTVYSTYCHVEQFPEKPLIGRGVANSPVYVLDGNRELVPVGVPGELYISGKGVGRGYLNKPEMTAERFMVDPFRPGNRMYKTGDAVRWLDGGQLEFLGRADNQVKLRGFRIELGEIESVLLTIPKVKGAVVLLREDQRDEKQLVGYLQFEQGEKLTVGEVRNFIREKLPEYMIPTVFVQIDEFPLTASGKLNRNALPKPEADRLEVGGKFVPPQTEKEQVIAEVWREVLGLKQVGVTNNFFELGGDSILAIQVVAKLTNAGFNVSPRHLFEAQTIRELAHFIETTDLSSTVESEQGIITGSALIYPTQKWFFDQNFIEQHHWNQALLFNVNQALDPEILSRTILLLLEHHDVLRLRFQKNINEEWEANYSPPESDAPLVVISLDKDGGNISEIIQQHAESIQGSLDLEIGPLIRFVLFRLENEYINKLLVVAHHLVIDGVSWRILLEDLWSVYSQFRSEGEAVLPRKTTSYNEWVGKLADYTEKNIGEQDITRWDQILTEYQIPFPRDYPQGGNQEIETNRIEISFTEKETGELLKNVLTKFNTEIDAVLLSALAIAINHTNGLERLLIAVESHGREEFLPDTSLTRTIGWFTAFIPIPVRIRFGEQPVDVLRKVKELIKREPSWDLEYSLVRYLHPLGRRLLSDAPNPQVVFNYLGQVNLDDEQSNVFEFAKEKIGRSRSENTHRPFLIEVNGGVSAGVLSMQISYSRDSFRDRTIQKMAQKFQDTIRTFIVDSSLDEVSVHTPSDFSLANLDQAKLDKILGKVKRRK